ncbi:hypothetical protein PQ455_18550 [Sphingomonas naphthae]|uniref:DUF883 family protein n=1 Tax=Sphingomonas naphthae TaxID=1813468 RepID=A0ABY7TKT8_9SPHN|nr:hypothetical protein [Sphingomonas naphthae]WCT73581.1 hypothetical protein PQ455_18550 [Sphingomonas naphthae]
MTKTTDAAEPASRFHDASSAIRDKADAAREAATDAYGSAIDKISAVTGKAASGIEANPVIALAGGLALGVIAGALLPRTARETELLGGVGGQINTAAKAAFEAGKAEGKSQIGALGFSGDAAREQVSKLASSAGEVASAIGAAALKAARDTRG